MRKDKRDWLDRLASDAETAANNGNMKGVYDITKTICKERQRQVDNIRDKDGKLLTKEGEVSARWKEHFSEVLNRPEPSEPADVENTDIVELDIDDSPPTYEEVRTVLRELKNGKAPGVDNITAELLRADIETTTVNMQKLIRKVWTEEKVPTDWKRGLIAKLPKKGDLTRCGNWRGITLIPTTAKVMGKIIVRRLVKEVDQHLREEQAGFRAGRGTTEQIFILRNILEQAIEWNSNLYTCFIDFEKAFDSVHRDTLWKIMRHYGIPEKYIRLVKCMYDNSECAVINGSGITEWFKIKSGVKQGCNMSGSLFLLVIDWIMRRTIADNTTGIRWNMMTKLDDLDYADDIALLSSAREQMQTKVDKLIKHAKSTGLNINASKTKVMRINANNNQAITASGEEIEDVSDSSTSEGLSTSKEVQMRISGEDWAMQE